MQEFAAFARHLSELLKSLWVFAAQSPRCNASSHHSCKPNTPKGLHLFQTWYISFTYQEVEDGGVFLLGDLGTVPAFFVVTKRGRLFQAKP